LFGVRREIRRSASRGHAEWMMRRAARPRVCLEQRGFRNCMQQGLTVRGKIHAYLSAQACPCRDAPRTAIITCPRQVVAKPLELE